MAKDSSHKKTEELKEESGIGKKFRESVPITKLDGDSLTPDIPEDQIPVRPKKNLDKKSIG